MDAFWQIIDLARKGVEPKTPSASPAALRSVLERRSVDDIEAFMREFCRKQIELNRWELWGAGYVIAGGMGDDGFHYFLSWIIGKGRDCFETALTNPEGLLPYLDNIEVENEGLEYVPLDILRGLDIDDDPREDVEGSPDDEPSGEPFDEDAVYDQYPALAEFARSFRGGTS